MKIHPKLQLNKNKIILFLKTILFEPYFNRMYLLLPPSSIHPQNRFFVGLSLRVGHHPRFLGIFSLPGRLCVHQALFFLRILSLFLKRQANLICRNGLLSSLFHKPTQRESIGGASDALNAFGNQFMVFEDIPFFWDAWDCMIYHQHKYKYIGGTITPSQISMHLWNLRLNWDPPTCLALDPSLSFSSSTFFASILLAKCAFSSLVCVGATSVTIVEKGPLRVGLNINFSISESSTIKQVVYLDALSPNLVFDTLVDWHESRKFLKGM